MESGIDELIQTFKEEAQEIFESLDMSLLDLEQDPESSELINGLFRSVHTLKGSAGMMGMEKTGKLAHALEDVMDRVRSKKLECTTDLVSLFFNVTDCLKDTVSRETTGKAISDKYPMFLGQLKEILSDDTPSFEASSGPGGITEAVEKKIADFKQKGSYIFIIEVKFDDMCLMKSSGAFLAVNGVGSFGEVVAVIPDVEDPAIEEIESFKIIIAMESDNTDDVKDAAEIPGMTDTATVTPYVKEEKKAQESGGAPGDKAASKQQEESESFHVKITEGKIEEMMSLVDELFIGKSRFNNLVGDLRTKSPTNRLLKPLVTLSRDLDKLTSRIQMMVMDVRRIPLDGELSRLNRQIRDLSMKYNQDVKLEYFSKDVEIDKNMWKKISDALKLLFESSICLSFSKKGEARGNITISANYCDSDISIDYRDDGMGAAESEVENIESIHEMINSINGKFTYNEPSEGNGIQCSFRIPTNSSKMDAFFFEINGNMFALPTACIDTILKVKSDQLKTIGGKKVIVHRNMVISLLDTYFLQRNVNGNGNGDLLSIVICENNKFVAVPVDDVIGEDEILVKKFEHSIFDTRYVLGATVLGDGRVIIILNPTQLLLEN